jgi:hypothetical protein
MLISEKDSVLPVYDTTIIHAKEAARQALGWFLYMLHDVVYAKFLW